MIETNQFGEKLILEQAKPNEQRHFFIEGELIISVPALPRQQVGLFYAPVGASFFCRHCARLWANCPVDNHTSQVFTTSCEECKPEHIGEVAGSIWMSWDWHWTSNLPKAVMEREFELHWRAYMSGHQIPID